MRAAPPSLIVTCVRMIQALHPLTVSAPAEDIGRDDTQAQHPTISDVPDFQQSGSSSGKQQICQSPSFAYAYCHGFLSGPGSVKGLALRESMLEVGVDMSLLNLNGEGSGPGAMLISGALQAVRQFHTDKKSAVGDPGLKLRLTGSSLGGFIVARFVHVFAFRFTGPSGVDINF